MSNNVNNSKPTMLKPDYSINNRIEVNKGKDVVAEMSNVSLLTCDNEVDSVQGNVEDHEKTSVTNPSVTPIERKVVINALSGRGSKYWLAGEINGVIEQPFADSAADVSCYPRHKTEGMQLKRLDKPLQVSGFREKEITQIAHTVDVEN